MKNGPLHLVLSILMLVAGVSILVFIMHNNNAGQRDFISYWAAGQQLRHGANPYDGAAILPIERAVGFDRTGHLIMRNPPVAFFMAAPLGYVNANTGVILWLLGLLASTVTSIRLLWILHGSPPNRLHLFSYYFAPLMTCMMAGQVGIFLLLGIVSFLYLHKSRPCLSGLALLVCALKPHLFLPFGIVLLLWIISTRSYRIFAGFCVALLASCALASYLDAHAWDEYLQMVNLDPIVDTAGPNLSKFLRLLLHKEAIWLQFLPVVAGCAWAVWFFWINRSRWSWMKQGLLVLLISEACAPYAWFTDESVILPAVISGVYLADKSGRSLLPFGVIAGASVIQVLAGVQITSPLYLWTVPSWLGWYLYASRVKIDDADRPFHCASQIPKLRIDSEMSSECKAPS